MYFEVLDLEQERWTKPELFSLALENFRSDLFGSYLLQPDKYPARHSSGCRRRGDGFCGTRLILAMPPAAGPLRPQLLWEVPHVNSRSSEFSWTWLTSTHTPLSRSPFPILPRKADYVRLH